VTIEDEGASTAETNTVSPGGGTATTTATFGDIDVVELSTDVDGSVTVEDGSANTLVTIQGSDSYPADEGDVGIPALESGSHASAIGNDYRLSIDDSITVPNAPTDLEIISSSLEVDTGLDDNSKFGTAKRNIHPTEWSYTWTASLAAPSIGHDRTLNYLTETSGTITWQDSDNNSESIDGNNTRISSPGTYTKESGQGKMSMDCEWVSESLTINA